MSKTSAPDGVNRHSRDVRLDSLHVGEAREIRVGGLSCSGCGCPLPADKRVQYGVGYCTPKCYQRVRLRRFSKLGAKKPKHCRICLQTGHNATTCEQRP